MEKDNRSLLELLYRVSHEVATAIDLRTVLQRVLYAAMDTVGGERGSIVVLDDNGNHLDSVIVHGKQIQRRGDTTRQLRMTVERGLAGWVVRNGKAALVPDTRRDKRWVHRSLSGDTTQDNSEKSAMCVPLMAREELVGILTLVHSIPNAFTNDHLALIQAIADQTGIAILNARLYTESQRQARVMTALAEGAATINASLKIKDVFHRILNQTIQALQVETVALALKESPSDDFVFRAVTGNKAGSILGKRVPKGEGLIDKVVTDRRGLVIPALKNENPYAKPGFFEGINSQGIAMAPIQAQGEIIGVIEAINPLSGEFDPDALLVLTGIGSLAGTTIQNARLFEEAAESRKRYSDLFHNSVDPILITDWEGKVIEVNYKALLLSKYNQRSFLRMKIEDVHEISWEDVGENFDYLRYDSSSDYESIFFVKGEKAIPVDVYVRSIFFGKEEAIQWTFRDIRESKSLDKIREDLTSMIYHDLCSPLANVISSVEVLDTIIAEQDETTQSLFKIAGNSANRMQGLIDSLLDINRLEAGQPIVSQKDVSPEEIIQEAVIAVQPLTNAQIQTLQIILPESLPNIWVDEGMIRRVFINLLENASKFTPREGSIEVGAKIDGKSILFWIADNGIGIAPEDRVRVFEKFTRTNSQNKFAGLGVGLAFCRLAIDGHKGKIWVDEKYERGTRFNISLPLEEVPIPPPEVSG